MAEKKGDAEQARFPEEQNPSGHDAEPAPEVSPSRIVTEHRRTGMSEGIPPVLLHNRRWTRPS